MSTMTKAQKYILILLVAGVACFIVPLPGGRATYTSVLAEISGPLHVVTNQVHRPAPWLRAAPEFFVKDGELYLCNQTTRRALILVTFVSPGIRDRADIEEFRKKHPDLEEYWPDPSQSDGGAAWTRNKVRNMLPEDTSAMGPPEPFPN